MLESDILVSAGKGGPLPEGLNPAETYLFLSLRALYTEARNGKVGKEQGIKEKAKIMKQYDEMKLWIRVVEEHRRKEREFEGAWEAFAKDPSPENGDALHKAWYNCGIKVPIDE